MRHRKLARKVRGFVLEINLAQMNLDQIETFQQAQQIVENHINDFPNSGGIVHLIHDIAYPGAAVSRVWRRRPECLCRTNDVRNARTI